MHVRRTVALALTLILAATAVTGCQRGRVGARCGGTGWGDDGGSWILRCQKGRWVRVITKADYVRLITPAAPTTTTTPAPGPTTPVPIPTTTMPPGPITSFGALTNAPIGNGPSLIPPGMYSTVTNGRVCDIVQDDKDGDWIGRRVGTHGPLVFKIRSDAERLTTTGPCVWSPATSTPSASAPNGDGVLRVGIDIAPGRYVATGSPTVKCYWETAAEEDGSYAAITDISLSTGPQMAVIEASDRLFSSSRCGTWTPLPVLPDAYFEVRTSPFSLALDGHRAFYFGDNLNLVISSSDTDDSIQANGQDWRFYFDGPLGRPITNEIWPTDGGWDEFNPRPILFGPGVSCFGEPGAVSVSNLQRGGSGEILGFDLYWVSQCGGASPNFVHLHLSPPPV